MDCDPQCFVKDYVLLFYKHFLNVVALTANVDACAEVVGSDFHTVEVEVFNRSVSVVNCNVVDSRGV